MPSNCKALAFTIGVLLVSILKSALETSKKMLPTASILIRDLFEQIPVGRVMVSEPSFGVFAAKTC